MSTPTNLIQLSFELAAERCRDLTPAVYRRLYREHPEAEAMFRREAGDRVKGSMLAMAIDAMIDFAGDRKGSFRMIECEVQSHDAYGTPRCHRADYARNPREGLVTGDRGIVAEAAG
jgi:hemoglobin-like flavoprotein